MSDKEYLKNINIINGLVTTNNGFYISSHFDFNSFVKYP